MTRRPGRLPPLNALRTFEAAARHLNFRLAADELGVTQGAVAQQVRGLEADLSLELFRRLPRGLALTDHGRGYAAQLRRAFDLMREATAGLPGERTQLVVSVPPTFASKWLIPRLADFRGSHPAIELVIQATEALANFQSDGVDLAVRQGRPPFGPTLVGDLLFQEEIVAVCSPMLLGEPPRLLSLFDLEQFPLLADAHDFWPEFARSALGRAGPSPAAQLRFSQTSLAIDAAIAGQGIAVASRSLVEHDIEAGRLTQVFTATLQEGPGFYAVSLRKPHQGRPTEAVRKWLLQQSGRLERTAVGNASGFHSGSELAQIPNITTH